MSIAVPLVLVGAGVIAAYNIYKKLNPPYTVAETVAMMTELKRYHDAHPEEFTQPEPYSHEIETVGGRCLYRSVAKIPPQFQSIWKMQDHCDGVPIAKVDGWTVLFRAKWYPELNGTDRYCLMLMPPGTERYVDSF